MERMEDWHFDYTDADMDAFVWEKLQPCDTLVIGRRSYEGFAAVWPKETGPIADRLHRPASSLLRPFQTPLVARGPTAADAETGQGLP